ncbi:membrane protein insertase YidC [bacterium]|jgi:YidC/Oxa1 family membrane protein insertase|nr:membrane protein insertase YidC [bacterium]
MNPITAMVDNIMIPFLESCYNFYPNYGVSILILTLVIKIIFFPLSKKQFEKMKITQKLQPKVKALQEKYKGNPQKIQQEMMKLWKENNANPLGGCLPALVQLPFFLAVFYTIKSDAFLSLLTVEGINPGFLIWPNLAENDTTYILPALIAATTYLSQKLYVTDPAQKQMMAMMAIFMPIMMFFVSLSMPVGVLLYWTLNQAVSGGIQYYFVKRKPAPKTT